MSGPSGLYTDPFSNTSDDYGHLYGHSGQNSPYEPMLSSHPQHVNSMSAPFSGTVFKTLMTASHDTLIRSGNAAYTSMHTQFIQARCELEAERNTVTRLQNIINKLTASHTPPMPIVSETGPRDGPIDTLVIPEAPDALDEADYPDVPYWCDSDWINHSDRQRDHGKTVCKLGFLTDKTGCPVSESRTKEFMAHAKQAWNELYRHRLDPSSWMKKTPRAALFFAHEMKAKYPEFCYCDGNWKLERFAIIKYPDWCQDARESGRLTHACSARPSKRKASRDSHKKEERKHKKAKMKLITPPNVPVIVVDEDVPNDTVVPPPTTTSTMSQVTEPTPTGLVPAPLSPPFQSEQPSTGAVPAPDAIAPTTTPNTTNTTPEATSTTGLVPLSPRSEPKQPGTGAAPAPDTIAPTTAPITANTTPEASSPTPTGLVPLGPVSQSKPSSTAAPAPGTILNDQTQPADAAPTDQVDTPLAPQPPLVSKAGKQSRRRYVNPLAGVSIPKPSFQVPAETLPASAARSLKSEKVMVASADSLTAQNLFARDYLKDRTGTLSKSEFKHIWDHIDSETRKKYDALSKALSKEKKLAARITSMATPPLSSGDSTVS